MNQFNAPIRRASGSVDVYTGLLFVALLILGAGIFLMASKNMDHSGGSGMMDAIKLVD